MAVSPSTIKEAHFNTEEAAKLLGLQTDTVKRYCNQYPPRIEGHKPFGEKGPWLIPQSAIDKYLAEESGIGRPKKARIAAQRQKRNGRGKH